MNPAARATYDEVGSASVPSGQILGASFFDRETVAVARDLLGKVLVREVNGQQMWGRLVEVEAYMGPEDLASHSSGGRRSPRNEVMYGPPGYAYVYFTYGMHHCLNFVTARWTSTARSSAVRSCRPNSTSWTTVRRSAASWRLRASGSTTQETGRNDRCGSVGTRRICRGLCPNRRSLASRPASYRPSPASHLQAPAAVAAHRRGSRGGAISRSHP